ncbi:MAG: TonB-dependent receptor [Acidobacteria bacterium]|nr:TonB-dependent receptor [Acidobacteriota bacterium]
MMKRCIYSIAAVGILMLLASPASAQDYRARVQGSVQDESQAALPGATVTLVNDATGTKAFKVSDALGRYLFDFVEPGTYTVFAELTGFKKAERTSIRVQQRGDVTANLTLQIGTLAETVTVVAETTQVQLNSSTAQVTLERQLIDQVPLAGRNPYSLAILDPTLNPGVGTTANENRPYHHAFASDYDAGGGTRRGNDVMLDGVPLGLSYKTAYTPAMDAVEEITVSKTSVDAENGHSLGGIISLSMKSGTNVLRGSGYAFFRDPSMNARADPTIAVTPGQDMRALRGTQLQMLGATLGAPIRKNKLFSFTAYEHWNDKRPISYVRTVPTEAERKGDFSQSVLNGKVRSIYDPFSSVLNPVTGKVVRTAFINNVIPTAMLDATALKMLQDMPLPNVPGNVDNLQYSVYDQTKYWNLSQRVDWNITNNWKVFVRYGQFKANLYQQNPTEAGFFPLSGSNRYGLSIAADSVWVISNKQTLNVRGSFNNLTDEFYNPSLELGADGLKNYWPTPWYSSLYNSGYVYYPALDVVSGTSNTVTTNRLGRQGREWWQHPKSWVASARMNWYEGQHNMKFGGEVRSYFGKAARFEPINLTFNSALTANSSDSPDIVNSGNQWASFMLGALDSGTSARLVPLQTPDLRGYAAYVQDDWRASSRLTLNVGLRWEYEPGPTDANNRLSVRYDLTSPIPEMQTTPPTMNAQALALMASKGYSYSYTGAWVFATKDSPNAWHATWKNFLPRIGLNYRLQGESVLRFAYARYMRATSDVRETLGDFVNQYSGFAQTTNTLGLAVGVPQQTLANPYPANNPVIEPYGQAYGRYTNLGGAMSLDQYEQRPQINDRFNVSYQRRVWMGIITDISYFYNRGSRVPYNLNLNMMNPAFRYEQKTVLNTQVPNPFRNYLTVDKFPGSLRNTANVTLGSLLVPYPQYGTITQTNTNGNLAKTHTFEMRLQRPFTKGLSFLASYAYNNEKSQQWFDDIANYKVLTSGGKDGWEWRPVADVPRHRFTAAVTWQLPIGKDRQFLTTMPTALDWVIGGWQYTAAHRSYSGRPLLFANSYVVSGNPKLDKPTRNQWFDTSMFAVLPDANTPRTNPWSYAGLNGPGWNVTDMTLTKTFSFGSKYRLEARIEAYNAFNVMIWENPDVVISSATFGKVTRKRVDGNGRELQVGLRFIF